MWVEFLIMFITGLAIARCIRNCLLEENLLVFLNSVCHAHEFEDAHWHHRRKKRSDESCLFTCLKSFVKLIKKMCLCCWCVINLVWQNISTFTSLKIRNKHFHSLPEYHFDNEIETNHLSCRYFCMQSNRTESRR